MMMMKKKKKKKKQLLLFIDELVIFSLLAHTVERQSRFEVLTRGRRGKSFRLSLLHFYL